MNRYSFAFAYPSADVLRILSCHQARCITGQGVSLQIPPNTDVRFFSLKEQKPVALTTRDAFVLMSAFVGGTAIARG